jgi:N-acyl-D-amino-acid deacylase
MPQSVFPCVGGALLLFSVLAGPAVSDDAGSPPRREQVRRAVERGLEIIQNGARQYPAHRDCFACHHQTLPLLGMTRAAAAEIPIDRTLTPALMAFTRKSFGDQIESLAREKELADAV